MLFYLDDSLLAALKGENRHMAVRAIHQIMEAWHKGDHLVLADRVLIEEVLREKYFEDNDSRLFKSLEIRLPQMGSLRNFKSFVQVVGEELKWEIYENNGYKIIQIGFGNIIKSHLTDQPLLLVENIRDESVYRKIAQASLFRKRNNVSLSYLPVSGGGGAIFECYAQYQLKKDRFCLCIVDSDKKYPGDSSRGTADKLLKTHQLNYESAFQCVTCDVYEIPAHEIENLIPTNIYEEIIHGNKERAKLVIWMEKLEKRDPESRLYIDIKKGFSFRDHIASLPRKEYWGRILHTDLMNCEVIRSGNCVSEACNCIIIPGIGDPLPEIIEHIGKLTSQKLVEASRSNPEISQIWDDLGERFLYWFCAEEPHYV